MKNLKTSLVLGLIAAAVNSIGAVQATETTSSPHSGMHDFDFLIGEWRVHHHRLKPDSQEWVDFDGTCTNRKLMDGGANMEEHALPAPYGAYRAIALRAYDPKTDQWAIWWLDGRYPSGPLDPPVKGRFENGVGTFYGDYMQDGKPMRLRFIWSDIAPTSARWEQAFSSDGGKTWATNWIMNFNRDIANRGRGAAERGEVHDFDFLHGVNASSGAYRAVALRSYDPKTSQWSIWWLSGRTPHDKLDPPVQGRFENGVGTFYGDTTVNGKPMHVRFIWSQIDSTSARWEQAYSPDAGKTWETNWTMEFRRAL
jgi:hypothetical protein